MTLKSKSKAEAQFFKTFGNIVRSLRLEKKLTLEDMQELGFSTQHFQKIESGKKAIGLFTAHRIAKAFGIKLSEIFRSME